MKYLIRQCTEEDIDAIISLWNGIFRNDSLHNEPRGSIERKLQMHDGLFFVAESDGTIIGTVMAGYDGHRGWLYSLAVDPDFRHRGIGASLVETAEMALKQLGCLKVNLQVLGDNGAVVEFYRKLGFMPEDRISMGKRLYGEESNDEMERGESRRPGPPGGGK